MYILSVDTTAKTAAVCLAKDDALQGLVPVSRLVLNSTVTHSESLLPMVGEALRLAGITLSQVDAFAITAGPGSFTGVRIGVSTVKGLAFSQGDIPCIPLSTLYCLALNLCAYGDNTIICPLMDARREQFYNAVFSLRSKKLKRLCEDRTITASELVNELCEKYPKKKIVLCGDGAPLFYSLYEKYLDGKSLNVSLALAGDLMQDAFSVARAGYEVISSPSFDKNLYTQESLSPLYLRLSQAERERNERLSNENK